MSARAHSLSDEVVAAVCDAVATVTGRPGSSVTVAAVDRLSGGASRLTWRVETDDGTAVIVQQERPGSGGTSLAMATQTALQRAAGDVGVPVPAVLAEVGEPGSSAVVLEMVAGEALPRRVLEDDTLADARSSMATEAGGILARLHSVRADSGPLDGVRLPAGDPLAQMTALLNSLDEPHPAFEIGLRWLEEHRPAPVPEVIVHGDFRLGNMLVGTDGITAVLDWELAHMGAPAEDLGWFCGRAWRFGSPLRAGGVGTLDDLLAGYGEAGGDPPSPATVDWWEAYGCLRWGLICVLQASVHLGGGHRSVELAAIGRRAAEAEEDLLEIVAGQSSYEPPTAERSGSGSLGGPHVRPTSSELLEAVQEHLDALRPELSGSKAFHLRVASNVLGVLHRELSLSHTLAEAHVARLAALGVDDDRALAAAIRSGELGHGDADVVGAVRESVRDKLAVAHPGYWLGDPPRRPLP